ncbi:MAG: phage tail protein [Oscillospiraceae bacterium]|nr:phage tail protein [Oscillospiraceae bacterium]
MAEIQTFSEVTLTLEALKLIAAAQTGSTITITRAAVGDGYLPDGTGAANLTKLVSEVESRKTGESGSSATVDISKMEVDGSGAQITITIKNGDTPFYLREVGIFAKGADGTEVLYAYTNAGDGAYPIPASSAASVTRVLVLGVIVSAEANVTANITYGEVTAEEFSAEIAARKAGDLAAAPFCTEAVIPADNWSLSGGKYSTEVEVEGVIDTMIPVVSIDTNSVDTADNAGMCPYAATGDGTVTFYAANAPTKDITVTIALIKTDGSADTLSSDTLTYTLPIASADTLGGVKIGDGITVAEDGTISVDTADITGTVSTEVIENVSASDEEASEAISEIMDN